MKLPGGRFPRLFHFMVLPISDPAGVLEMKVNPSGMMSVSSSLKGTSPVFETLMAKSVIVPGEPEDGDTASEISVMQYQIGDKIHLNSGPFCDQNAIVKDITKTHYVLILESLGYVLKVKHK